jgi:hypothetical protein
VDVERVRAASTASRPFLLDTAARRSWIDFRRDLSGIDELALRDASAVATRDDAVRALARVIDPDRALVVIVGPAATIEPQIGQLGGTSGTIPFDHVW